MADDNKNASPGEEESQGMEDLIRDDEEKQKEEDAEDTGEESDEESEEEGEEAGGDDDEYQRRIDEKEQENVFLRGEIAKLTRAREQETARPPEKVDEPLFNYEDIARRLVDKDPRVAARTIEEMATKIATRMIEKGQIQTQEMVRGSDQERSAKERDRDQTYADFERELDDPDFEKLLTQIFRNNTRANGRYVPDTLYQSAATAKVILDKQRARAAGTKNGVTEVRGRRESPETITADTHDYSKVVTIEGIPNNMMSANEKRAARAAARTMGVSEKAWVRNFFAARDEDSNFGR